MSFETDPRLLAHSVALAPMPLCDVRLQDDGRFAWLVLIPRVVGATELDDLSRDQRIALMDDVTRAAEMVRDLGRAMGRPVEKLNVAALGNVTAQLHVHVVGRRRDDPLWPDPIWGRGEALRLGEAELARLARGLEPSAGV